MALRPSCPLIVQRDQSDPGRIDQGWTGMYTLVVPNCENATVKKGQKWISCLKEPTFCQKSQLVKLAKKLRKSQLFETNLDLNW